MERFRFSTQGVNAAIDYTTPAMGNERTLKTLYAHSVVASGTSENLVITLVSHLGANFDTALVTKDMDTVADYFVADINALLHPQDKLKVTYTNTDSETISVLLVVE